MSFHLTDLHTIIVKTHKLRNIPIGKITRAALLAAVDGRLALRNHRGEKLSLNQRDRDTYEAFAAKAEQQSPHQLLAWSHWKALLRRVLVDEKEFLSWFDNDASSTVPAVATTATPMTKPEATAPLQMAEPDTATRIVEDEPTPRVQLVIQALDAQGKVFNSLPASEQLGRVRNWVKSKSHSSKTTVSERTLRAAKAYRRKHPKQ
jgi:hypothetical protein